jgi:hypothetical protein
MKGVYLMKVLMTGPAGFKDKGKVEQAIQWVMDHYDEPIILTRARKGLDQLIEEVAWKAWLTVQRFHPEDASKAALAARDADIVKRADKAVIFYDGEDDETETIARYARNKGLKGKVYRV